MRGISSATTGGVMKANLSMMLDISCARVEYDLIAELTSVTLWIYLM